MLFIPNLVLILTISNGCISSFNRPHRLTESAHSRGRIEHNFGAVQSVHHPVLRMMTTVADVDRNATPLGLKNRMT